MIDQKTEYWVQATKSANIITLTSTDGLDCEFIVDGNFIIQLSDGFTIPSNSFLISPRDEESQIEFAGTAYVKGTVDVVRIRLLGNNAKLVVDGKISASVENDSSSVKLKNIVSDNPAKGSMVMYTDQEARNDMGISGYIRGLSDSKFSFEKVVFNNVTFENLNIENISEYPTSIKSDLICGPDVTLSAKFKGKGVTIEEMIQKEFYIINKGPYYVSLGLIDVSVEEQNSMTTDKMSANASTVMKKFTCMQLFGEDVSTPCTRAILYPAVELCETEGIISISSEYKNNIAFIKSGASIDLSAINVVCKKDYKFVGWCYYDEYGVEHMIKNPSTYVPSEDVVTVYAKATAVTPEPEPQPEPQPGPQPGPQPTPHESNDSTVLIVSIVFIVAILGLIVALIGRGRN